MKPNWIDRCAWIAQVHANTIRREHGRLLMPRRARDEAPGESTGVEHLLFMCYALIGREMSETKACRWLGWLQACMCQSGMLTLGECKTLNFASSQHAKVTEATEGKLTGFES